MSPSERFTNPSSKGDGINDDAKKSAVLPTSNTPGTDSSNSPKRGSDGKQGQSGNSGKGQEGTAPKSEHRSGFRAPAGKPTNGNHQR